MRDNVSITRSQLGQWGSYIGSTALLLAILGIIWQAGITIVILILIGIGVGGVALWAVMTPDDFRAFLRGRQARYGTSAFFSTLLLVGIVSLGYIILQRAVITLDMTQDTRFSLSNESLEVLERVEQPIQITGFYSVANLEQRELDDLFFRLYETATNGLIRRVYINPDEQPAVANTFGAIDGDVFVSLLNPDGTINLESTLPVPRASRQERDVTGAIARLLIAGVYTVYFETGHGSLDPIAAEQGTISQLNNLIRESGLRTAPISLEQIVRDGGIIPNSAAALILARPLTDLSEQEVALVSDYLARGGGLLVLTDMLFNQGSFMGENSPLNNYLWNTFGIRAGNSVIVDAEFSAQTALDIFGAAVFTDSPMGANLNNEETPTLFRIVRAIEVNDTPPTGTSNGRVIMSSPSSFGETNLTALSQTNTYQFDAGQDVAGPLAFVAWGYAHASDGRVVVIGDSDFATNGFMSRAQGNSVLLLDSIFWLSGYSDSEQIIYNPQITVTSPLIFVSGQMLDLIAFVTVVLIPGIVLATGLFVWRKRASGR